MVEPTCEKLHKWKENGYNVTTIRCDNAGENVKLQKRSDSAAWKLNLTFEFTARDTPQQNHLAELAFATESFGGTGICGVGQSWQSFDGKSKCTGAIAVPIL